MIIIGKPKIQERDNKIVISTDFEIEREKKELWYSFDHKFEEYLVTEQIDAFVIGLLFLGLKTGNDIKLEAPVSARLFYQLNHYIIDALCSVNPAYHKIKIIPFSLSTLDLNTRPVSATGLSCGIDSMTTFFEHVDEINSFKIEFFTFFNVGSHGDCGGDNARKIFWDRFNNISEFAKKVDKELVTVDSNLSEILEMKFQETYNLRTISCTLLLQKLFKNYYYSSGTRFDHYQFNKNEIADIDMLVIPNLSTESTSIFVSALRYSRIERTDLISKFPESYNHLDVCTHPNSKNENSLNCSECYKCLRTMLTLELLGKLDLYTNVFDIQKFRSSKNNYIGWLMTKKKKLTLDRELIKYYKQKESINLKIYFFQIKNFFYRKKNEVKKILK